jgi:hypothetical protein
MGWNIWCKLPDVGQDTDRSTILLTLFLEGSRRGDDGSKVALKVFLEYHVSIRRPSLSHLTLGAL